MVFQFTDVDFTDQRRDILVVLITRFGFSNRNLFQNRRPDFHHAEFGNVTAKFMQAFRRPRRHNRAEIATGNAVLFIQDLRIFLRVKQTQRMVVDRAAFAVGAEHVNGHALHQGFQPLGQRGFTTADRTQQIQDLFLLFQTLSSVLQVGNNLLDGIFHAVKFFKRRISGDDPIRKQTGKPWLLGSINHIRLTDSHQ